MPRPPTTFHWPVYANATFAGLSVLIPLPLVDWLFEEFFRRRILPDIISYRERQVDPAIIETLNKTDGILEQGCVKGCFNLIVLLTYGLLKRLSRKLLYFLTIKEATDRVNLYWHRAFLMDYMLRANHLDTQTSAAIARQAMDEVIETTNTSPLLQLAQQVVTGTRHILRTLRRAWRGKEDEVIEAKRAQMVQQWGNFEVYFKALAERYDQLYQKFKAQQEAEDQTSNNKSNQPNETR